MDCSRSMSLAFMNNWSTSEADLCIFTNIVETIEQLATEHVHCVVSSDWRAVRIVVIQLSDPCGCRGLSGLVVCLAFSPSGSQSNLQSLIELKLASTAGTTACQGGKSVSLCHQEIKRCLCHTPTKVWTDRGSRKRLGGRAEKKNEYAYPMSVCNQARPFVVVRYLRNSMCMHIVRANNSDSSPSWG